jgi:hypothetical protein
MSKVAGRTRDELIKDFGQRSVPPNSFPGAAEPNFSTFPADQRTGETPFAEIVGRRTAEYTPPPSNLPVVCTQAESLRRNCESGQSPWTSETESEAPLLAGTRSAAPSTTPKSPRVVPEAQRDSGWGVGEAIAEGHPGEALSEAANTIAEPAEQIANVAGSAAMMGEV